MHYTYKIIYIANTWAIDIECGNLARAAEELAYVRLGEKLVTTPGFPLLQDDADLTSFWIAALLILSTRVILESSIHWTTTLVEFELFSDVSLNLESLADMSLNLESLKEVPLANLESIGEDLLSGHLDAGYWRAEEMFAGKILPPKVLPKLLSWTCLIVFSSVTFSGSPETTRKPAKMRIYFF